jgi:hypothetical protein
MAELLLERPDVVAPPSGWVTSKWQQRVMSGRLGGVGMARPLLYM